MRVGGREEGDAHHGLLSSHDFPAGVLRFEVTNAGQTSRSAEGRSVLTDLCERSPDVRVVAPAKRKSQCGGCGSRTRTTHISRMTPFSGLLLHAQHVSDERRRAGDRAHKRHSETARACFSSGVVGGKAGTAETMYAARVSINLLIIPRRQETSAPGASSFCASSTVLTCTSFGLNLPVAFFLKSEMNCSTSASSRLTT